MTLYLFTFIISLIFLKKGFSEKGGKRTLFLMMGVLFPSVLAGLRDPGIGTDTLVYANDVWHDIVKTKDYGEMLKKASNDYYSAADKGYLSLNYLASYFGTDIHILYFFTSLTIVFLVLLVAWDNRHRASSVFVFFLFFFVFYNSSLNIIRQSIAMSLCGFAYRYVERRDWLKVLLWQIIIVLFHSTGIVFSLSILIYYVYHMKNRKAKYSLLSFGLLLLLALFTRFNKVLTFVVASGVIPVHYEMYMSEEEGGLQTSLMIMYIVVELVFLISIFIVKSKDYRRELAYYLTFHTFAILLSALTVVSYWAYRIALYSLFISILIFLPRTLFFLKGASRQKYRMAWFVVVLICIFTWWYTIVYRGDTETCPYTSAILGISK